MSTTALAPTATSPTFTVGEVARLAGVTVRTLHHYDAIGLLPASARTAAGYRRYRLDDLERLQRILFYRELDVPLEDIARLLDGDDDPTTHLLLQRDELLGRIGRLQRLVTVLDRTLEARKMSINLDPDEMFEVFGDIGPGEHAEEAENRWGDTDAWRQSRQRTARYTKDDWLRFRHEQEALGTDMVAAIDAGVAPDDEQGMELAERARLQIDQWFYDCSHAMHVDLGQMYVDDPRFTATYEQQREGLARLIRDAIVANARRHGVDA